MDMKPQVSSIGETAVIKTESLTMKYGKITAVDSLDLEVEEGEIFGLLGLNGAGKTTLISMLCTILKPTSGRAWVNCFDIVKGSGKVRKSIGIVFQAPSVDDLLTGRENLQMHNLLFGVAREIRRQRIDEVLSLDEPTLGLDPQTREHIWEYISDLAKKECMTVMLTTHFKKHIVGDIVILKQQTFGIEALKNLEYVRKVEEKDGLLYISIKNAGKHLQDLLTHTGMIDFVVVRSGTLNDVFMHYTGREIREAEAEGGFWERMMKR